MINILKNDVLQTPRDEIIRTFNKALEKRSLDK